jgi:hypothetical protein
VWYPRYQQKKVNALKASGRQGEATIILLRDHDLGPQPGRSSVFTMVPIGLEIRVLGLEACQVDKTFTFPIGSARDGQGRPRMGGPESPRNPDKIGIDLK